MLYEVIYFDKPFNSLELMAYQNDDSAALPCVITMPGHDGVGGTGPNGMSGINGRRGAGAGSGTLGMGGGMSRGASSPALHSPNRPGGKVSQAKPR